MFSKPLGRYSSYINIYMFILIYSREHSLKSAGLELYTSGSRRAAPMQASTTLLIWFVLTLKPLDTDE